MISVKFENYCYIYENENKKKVLLDCTNYIKNKSRIPLLLPNAKPALPYFLSNLYNAYSSLFVEGHAPNDGIDYLLIDILLSSQLIKSALPQKVAELGCTNGRLSYHLASVVGAFHPNSTLCCICDSIGNESGNNWLDMISLVENPSKLSMVASDYDDTNLSDNHFDIVIINGSVQIDNADALIKEAKRIVKTNGIIICYAWNQPHIAQSMKQAFSSFDEYPTNPNVSILLTLANTAIQESDTILDWKKDSLYDLEQAETLLLSSSNKIELMNMIQKLNQHADFATANNFLDIKVDSLLMKEKLLIKYIDLK